MRVCGPGTTARAIRNFLRVDEGYLSRTVDRLVRKGLIIKKRSATDGREYLLSLSQEGRKEFQVLNRASEREIRVLIEKLSPAELSSLVEMIASIESMLDKERAPSAKD